MGGNKAEKFKTFQQMLQRGGGVVPQNQPPQLAGGVATGMGGVDSEENSGKSVEEEARRSELLYRTTETGVS